MVLVTAYGLNYSIIFSDRPLDKVQGMAYGVREDAITGRRRGIVTNQCSHPDSREVYMWEIKAE